MLNAIKQILIGTAIGFKWYKKVIKESKWYIIPCMIDVLMIPLKLVVIPLICLTKGGRNYFYNSGKEIFEETEED